jgi:hypothetical protein
MKLRNHLVIACVCALLRGCRGQRAGTIPPLSGGRAAIDHHARPGGDRALGDAQLPRRHAERGDRREGAGLRHGIAGGGGLSLGPVGHVGAGHDGWLQEHRRQPGRPGHHPVHGRPHVVPDPQHLDRLRVGRVERRRRPDRAGDPAPRAGPRDGWHDALHYGCRLRRPRPGQGRPLSLRSGRLRGPDPRRLLRHPHAIQPQPPVLPVLHRGRERRRGGGVGAPGFQHLSPRTGRRGATRACHRRDRLAVQHHFQQ